MDAVVTIGTIVLVEGAPNRSADRTVHQCVTARWVMHGSRTIDIANRELALLVRQEELCRGSVLNDGASDFIHGVIRRSKSSDANVRAARELVGGNTGVDSGNFAGRPHQRARPTNLFRERGTP